MPDKNVDATNVTKYTDYFNISAPTAMLQTLVLLIIGAITGIIALAIVQGSVSVPSSSLIPEGASIGIMIVSIPALLTSIVLKAIKRKLKMRHTLFGTIAITLFYSLAIIAAATTSSIFGQHVLAYIILIVANAAIYGYWFFIDKVVIGDRRRSILFGAVQPVINILMYIPFNNYLFSVAVPVPVFLFKLYAGMLVFLVVGYVTIYLLDRPAKKQLDISGIAIFTAMVNQWLFDINPEANFLGDVGVTREVSIDILVLKGKKRYKAVFVKPDIHYGPFSNVGGSITTELLGNMISDKFSATPFIMHGAVNIDDNPISTAQVQNMRREIDRYVTEKLQNFKSAAGKLEIGVSGMCKAINIEIGDVNLLTLTKAPSVTEDIDRDVGKYLEKCAKNNSRTILVDAHNSRFETAPKNDLRGIYKGSNYIKNYKEAIEQATGKYGKETELRFGSAGRKIRKALGESLDIGNGYTSVGVFDFGKKKFALIYIDANNMMPEFRHELVEHVKRKYGMDCEVCTTDTHSVNTIALPASNTVGRVTRLTNMLPIMDSLIEDAKANMEPVKYAYGKMIMPDFKVWGVGAEELLIKVGKEGLHVLKHIVPIIVVAGFIIACWIIYIA